MNNEVFSFQLVETGIIPNPVFLPTISLGNFVLQHLFSVSQEPLSFRCILSYISPRFWLLCKKKNEPQIKAILFLPNNLWRDQTVSKKIQYIPAQSSIIFLLKKKIYHQISSSHDGITGHWSSLFSDMITVLITMFLELPRIMTPYPQLRNTDVFWLGSPFVCYSQKTLFQL